MIMKNQYTVLGKLVKDVESSCAISIMTKKPHCLESTC